MTSEKAKYLLPIIRALAEGKTIQYNFNEGWRDVNIENLLGDISKYRIKPELKYRPFKTKEECWEEMLKHQPFGWVTDMCKYFHIVCVRQGNIEFSPDEDSGVLYSCIMTFSDILEQGFTFADGTPFGIKED